MSARGKTSRRTCKTSSKFKISRPVSGTSGQLLKLLGLWVWGLGCVGFRVYRV